MSTQELEELPEVVPGHWTTAAGRQMAAEYAAMDRPRMGTPEDTDFALANALYLALGDIEIQTAAKERMRWLSVQLVIARRNEERALSRLRAAEAGNEALKATGGYQAAVAGWVTEAFGQEIADDTVERNFRFFEEAGELVQAQGCSRQEAHALVEYVYGRPVGDPSQEVGGVMVTLAALCQAAGIDMAVAGQVELDRIRDPQIMARIRAKQAEKSIRSSKADYRSPLPGLLPQPTTTDGGA